MVKNILLTMLETLKEEGNVKDITAYGVTTLQGDVFDKESELTLIYVNGVGLLSGVVGETRFKLLYNSFINKHSFKLTVDGKPEFIVDQAELVTIVKEHF